MRRCLLTIGLTEQLSTRLQEILLPLDVIVEAVRDVDELPRLSARQRYVGLVWNLPESGSPDTDLVERVLTPWSEGRLGTLFVLTGGWIGLRRLGEIERATPIWLKRSDIAARSAETRDLFERGIERSASSTATLNPVTTLPLGNREIIIASNSTRRVWKQLARIARHDVPILLVGETGTGKTSLAVAIHRISPRSDGPLQIVACGTLPPNLIESELFGHVQGAFTGATSDRKGRLEAADGGTLLLDEIDTLTLKQQVKLLRVLETGEFEPVGTTQTKRTNVRLIVASNRELKQLVDAGEFRSDLYFRLNTLTYSLLPLRERRDEIGPLAVRFAREFARKYDKPIQSVHIDYLNALKSCVWPGNVRELRNQVERSVLLCDQGLLLPVDLGPEVIANAAAGASNAVRAPLHERIARMERIIIQKELHRHNYDRTVAARALGMTREGLYKKLKRLGLDASAWRGHSGQ